MTPPKFETDLLAAQEKVHSLPFNLAHLETKLGTKAIFTPDLLQEIKNNKATICSEMRKAPHFRTLSKIDHTTRFGKYKVWEEDEDDDDCNHVTIRLMTRVELHPDFQFDYWKYSKINRILRVTNHLQGEKSWVPVPYGFTLESMAWDDEHENKKVMQEYRAALWKTMQLWLKSSSRGKIIQTTDKIAAQHKSITKVVCFGLGALSRDKVWYQSAVQHMTAFTIAKCLERAYRKEGAHVQPVDIIFQDPCYTRKDHELLRTMYPGGRVSFASDPDGLLAIDSNTIVLTAFLPVAYPLMQVMADMFHGRKGEGPAAIICDDMALDLDQELYTLRDRASPAVARFLTQEYTASDFKEHVLEPELFEDLYGAEGRYRKYWLSRMRFHTRK
ncbi:hypothetical protein C7974DRAFT_350387 [Boeremia exigua]|uniref:uncharacterized protein n=1 Tax=Boeremia exigua TaxID=749465 RepID=UPI001E8D5A41|nr:uncharacterized protein C7974DRAFT_350387 [Boeremia exigua]KAH6642119.1 hypothetical protein C7974DRAFT_350387 [Boeremia exigua]